MAQLLNLGGPELLKMYGAFAFSEAEINKLRPALEKFDSHFIPKKIHVQSVHLPQDGTCERHFGAVFTRLRK